MQLSCPAEQLMTDLHTRLWQEQTQCSLSHLSSASQCVGNDGETSLPAAIGHPGVWEVLSRSDDLKKLVPKWPQTLEQGKSRCLCPPDAFFKNGLWINHLPENCPKQLVVSSLELHRGGKKMTAPASSGMPAQEYVGGFEMGEPWVSCLCGHLHLSHVVLDVVRCINRNGIWNMIK